jgi:hypothetical protein
VGLCLPLAPARDSCRMTQLFFMRSFLQTGEDALLELVADPLGPRSQRVERDPETGGQLHTIVDFPTTVVLIIFQNNPPAFERQLPQTMRQALLAFIFFLRRGDGRRDLRRVIERDAAVFEPFPRFQIDHPGDAITIGRDFRITRVIVSSARSSGNGALRQSKNLISCSLIASYFSPARSGSGSRQDKNFSSEL